MAHVGVSLKKGVVCLRGDHTGEFSPGELQLEEHRTCREHSLLGEGKHETSPHPDSQGNNLGLEPRQPGPAEFPLSSHEALGSHTVSVCSFDPRTPALLAGESEV